MENFTYMIPVILPLNHVGPTLPQHEIRKRMVGITLANAGLVGLRALDQNRTNRWQLSIITFGQRHLSTSDQQNCQQNANQRWLNEALLSW